MPGLSGLEITRAVQNLNLNCRVVILTSIEDDASLYQAFLAGAKAYTLKDIPSAELYATLKMVASGLTLIQPSVARYVLGELHQDTRPAEFSAQSVNGLKEILTDREQEILGLIARGFKNKEIAEQLFISEGTVKVHVNNILRKMSVSTRSEAIAKALNSDLFKT